MHILFANGAHRNDVLGVPSPQTLLQDQRKRVGAGGSSNYGGSGGCGGGYGRRKNRATIIDARNGISCADGEKKTVYSGCYFCEGAHNSSECSYRMNALLTSTSNGSNSRGRMIANVITLNPASDIEILGSVDPGTVLTVSVPTSTRDQYPDREYWIEVGGATKNTTANGTDLEDYIQAPPGEQVESADGKLLPMVGYRRLRLLVDQGNGSFGSET